MDYVNQNYLDYHTEDRFDLIIMILCDYCVLSPSQRKTMLNKFFSILKPGGSVLLEEAGFVKPELYGNLAGAAFDETDSEFAIVARR